MYRITIALGLVTALALPAAAQTPGIKPLPPATVARIRLESQRVHQDAERARLMARRPPGLPSGTLTPRPPKARPVDGG